jgi:hypothetical protein
MEGNIIVERTIQEDRFEEEDIVNSGGGTFWSQRNVLMNALDTGFYKVRSGP